MKRTMGRWLNMALVILFLMAAGKAFPAVDFRAVWTSDFGDKAAQRDQSILDEETALLQRAFRLVQKYPAAKLTNPFQISIKKKRTVILLGVVENDPVLSLIKDSFFDGKLSAATLPDQEDLFVFLYFHKLIHDKEGRIKPAALPQLVLALAHELYGNVPFFLAGDIGEKYEMSRTERREREIAAYRAELDFASQFKESVAYKEWPSSWKLHFNSLITQDTQLLSSL